MADDFSGLDPEKYKEISELLKEHGLYVKKIREEHAGLSKEARKYLESIKDSYSIQKDMRTGINGLVDALKKINDIQKQIKAYEKEVLVLKEKIATLSKEESKGYVDILNAIESEIDKLKVKKKLLEDNYKAVNKTGIAFKEIGKAVGKLPDTIKNVYTQLKTSGLFEMDKAVKKSVLSMGLLGGESNAFRATMKSAALDAGLLGTSFEELVRINADYAEELGRNVQLGKQGALAINEIAKGTTLGLEAATKLSAEMENQGLSAERTRDYIDQTLQDTQQMGLNSSKVIKNIQNNIKMLNKYNFKQGVKGLAKMAQTVSKLGVDMNMIAPMAEKLFDIEGAVELSAQLQVLGGEWSKLADPFKLMYMARNDVDALTESIGKAAAASAHFAKDGSIQLSSLEMSRLRKIAEQTGIAYDDLVTAGKNMFKMTKIGATVQYKDKDVQEFIKNTAQFDENKKAYIMMDIGGKLTKKFLNELDSTDEKLIKDRLAQKKILKEQAEAALTFDEQLNGVISGLKVTLLPIVEVMNEKLMPRLKAFVDRFNKEEWGKIIETIGTRIGEFISWVGKLIIDNPFKTALTIGGAKLIGFLADKGNWLLNGRILGMGFNSVANVGGGSQFRGGSFSRGKELLNAGRGGAGLMGYLGRGAIGGLGGYAIGSLGTSLAGRESTTTGNVASLVGTIAGGIIGSFAGPAGTMIGSAIGSSAGKFFGDMLSQEDKPNIGAMNDGIIKFNSKDKFTKVNDSTMIAGTNENGNMALAKAIMSSTVPGFAVADYLASNKKSQVNPAVPASSPSTLKIEFGELKLSGEVNLVSGNNVSNKLGEELIKSPSFVRDITKLVHVQTNSAIKGTTSG